jgi:hypothetical protein
MVSPKHNGSCSGLLGGRGECIDLHLISDEEGRTRVELWQGDFAGLPLAVRRTREVGKLWVEKLVGLKRVAEELAQAKAA